jgi:Ni/Co efflux regulator RcnB
MNRAVIVLLLVALPIASAAAAQGNQSARTSEVLDRNQQVVTWTDPDTGCQYLTRSYFGAGLTPRLDRDGEPMCGAE